MVRAIAQRATLMPLSTIALPCKPSIAWRALLAAAIAVIPSLASGQEPSVLSPPAQRGLVFVRTHCAHCHSIDKITPSPLKDAPPFRTLHLRYPVESLEESLAEGIITRHPTMPQFRLDPGQIADVIAYLKSLEQ
jgi:cytochrome c